MPVYFIAFFSKEKVQSAVANGSWNKDGPWDVSKQGQRIVLDHARHWSYPADFNVLFLQTAPDKKH